MFYYFASIPYICTVGILICMVIVSNNNSRRVENICTIIVTTLFCIGIFSAITSLLFI